MAKTIYYLPHSGQLGNQMAILAHLLAFANKFGYHIVFPHSLQLEKCLRADLMEKGFISFSKILSSKVFSALIIKVIKYITLNKNLNLSKLLIINKRFVIDEQLSTKSYPSNIIITDWMFRFYAEVDNQKDEIISLLSFNDEQSHQPQNFISKIQKELSPGALIGIHVRRGDYATWQGGRFHYDITTYYAKMQQIASLISNCVFVICSNERVHFNNTDNLKLVYANGSATEDLCALSNCDYILGPPSTFSGWAAFLGRRPIYFLKSRDEVVSLDKFLTHQI
jgi:hypothetical protein